MAQINDSSGMVGAAGKIYVDLDMVSQSLQQLARSVEELPQADEVARRDGPHIGAAWEFYWALSQATTSASDAATAMRQCLAEADASIRAAVAALTAQDADAQASADKVMDALDSNTALAGDAGSTAGGSVTDTTGTGSTVMH